jgi:hypothetical protein
MNLQPSIKRFVLGMAVGLFIAAIFWSYSAFYYVPISSIYGVVGTVLLAVCCGIIATVSSLDKLMDNINFPF